MLTYKAVLDISEGKQRIDVTTKWRYWMIARVGVTADLTAAQIASDLSEIYKKKPIEGEWYLSIHPDCVEAITDAIILGVRFELSEVAYGWAIITKAGGIFHELP